jgi:hypothetical protein
MGPAAENIKMTTKFAASTALLNSQYLGINWITTPYQSHTLGTIRPS